MADHRYSIFTYIIETNIKITFNKTSVKTRPYYLLWLLYTLSRKSYASTATPKGRRRGGARVICYGLLLIATDCYCFMPIYNCLSSKYKYFRAAKTISVCDQIVQSMAWFHTLQLFRTLGVSIQCNNKHCFGCLCVAFWVFWYKKAHHWLLIKQVMCFDFYALKTSY